MKVRFTATFGGFRVAKDGIVTLKFIAPMTELSEAVKTVMLIDSKFAAAMKLDDDQGPISLGKAVFKSLSIDRHGESSVSLDTTLDEIEANLSEFRGIIGRAVYVGLAL